MPRDLASDPERTVFDYRAIISPPKDWGRWERLVGDLADHLVERYGREEVRTWGFEYLERGEPRGVLVGNA